MRLQPIFVYSLLILLIFGSLDAEAQRRSKYGKSKNKNKAITRYHGGMVGGRFRPYEFAGLNINALNYYGDLAPLSRAASTDVSFTRPGFGFNFGYKFQSQMAVRAGLNWGRLQGSDFSADPALEVSGGRYQRNLSFRNDIYEFHLGLQIYLFPNYGGPNVRLPFNAYVFAGGGVFYHDPKGLVPDFDYQSDPNGSVAAPQAGNWVSLRKLGTEGQNLGTIDKKPYSPIQLSIPFGIGARLRIPDTPFDVGLEIGYRYLFTDYVDDVSGTYVKLDEFDDPVARIMSARGAEAVDALSGDPRENISVGQGTGMSYYVESNEGGGDTTGQNRGNPKDNDAYIVTTLKVTYILGTRKNQGAKHR
ncbi:DUF6089 family protein [Marinoscillum sp. MHG1-6]|uniref:DUF6089 family protein n=1 Tax=Marinoscillum sp. MHG1-6 TaxID=2959627 RepID=UPI0021585518|nr:DUF6089 family protein [Marinoscillum sp. MHG1-6]